MLWVSPKKQNKFQKYASEILNVIVCNCNGCVIDFSLIIEKHLQML